MSKRAVSIATQAIIGIIGIIFFIKAYHFPSDSSGNAYIAAGYYPMLVCGLMTLFSVTGIYGELFGKEKENRQQLELGNKKNFIMVVVATVVIAGVWQVFNSFYLIGFLVFGAILLCLKPGKINGRKIGFSYGIAALFIGVLYLLFDILLKIRL